MTESIRKALEDAGAEFGKTATAQSMREVRETLTSRADAMARRTAVEASEGVGSRKMTGDRWTWSDDMAGRYPNVARLVERTGEREWLTDVDTLELSCAVKHGDKVYPGQEKEHGMGFVIPDGYMAVRVNGWVVRKDDR